MYSNPLASFRYASNTQEAALASMTEHLLAYVKLYAVLSQIYSFGIENLLLMGFALTNNAHIVVDEVRFTGTSILQHSSAI